MTEIPAYRSPKPERTPRPKLVENSEKIPCTFCGKKIGTHIRIWQDTKARTHRVRVFNRHSTVNKFITGEKIECFKSNQPIK